MWDIRSGEKASKYARPDGYVANLDIDFSLDGSKVVTSSKDGTIRIWDAASGKQEKLIRIHNGKGDVTTARFTPEGRHVITLSSNGVCWILRVEANFNAE